MISAAAVLIVLGAPLRVQVVTQGDGAALVRAARGLRSALAQSSRLQVADEVGVPRQAPQKSPEDLSTTRDLLERARQDYAKLDPHAALSKIRRAEDQLRPRLDHPGAPALLARALRLRGLTQLFMEDPEEAAQSFAAAMVLHADFSPAAEEWPPEARLAFADAGARMHRAATGSLSVRVEPKLARVWLDGRDLGLGSTTVRDLAPGSHFLLVSFPGHTSFSAVVTVVGDGKLNHASVFLEPLPGVLLEEQGLNELAGALGGAGEANVVRQMAHLLGVQSIVLVGPDRLSGNGSPVAWLLEQNGERKGGFVALTSIQAAAGELAVRMVGIAEEQPDPVKPWYMRWYTWVAAGVVVVGGGIVLGWAVSQDDRRSFYIQGPH